MLDIRQALKVRGMSKRNYRIGIIKSNFPHGCTMGGTKPGDVVLFRTEDDVTCTIDTPMSDAWIAEQKANGSALTTTGTCVGVPLRYIEEILF